MVMNLFRHPRLVFHECHQSRSHKLRVHTGCALSLNHSWQRHNVFSPPSKPGEVGIRDLTIPRN